ncbi:hypothetical protein Tcan_00863, partial [Toxocara canis]
MCAKILTRHLLSTVPLKWFKECPNVKRSMVNYNKFFCLTRYQTVVLALDAHCETVVTVRFINEIRNVVAHFPGIFALAFPKLPIYRSKIYILNYFCCMIQSATSPSQQS